MQKLSVVLTVNLSDKCVTLTKHEDHRNSQVRRCFENIADPLHVHTFKRAFRGLEKEVSEKIYFTLLKLLSIPLLRFQRQEDSPLLKTRTAK